LEETPQANIGFIHNGSDDEEEEEGDEPDLTPPEPSPHGIVQQVMAASLKRDTSQANLVS
jgi:hypothetical protein